MFPATLARKEKLITYLVGFGVGVSVPTMLGISFAQRNSAWKSSFLTFSSDGTLLATGDGSSIRIWNPQTLIEVMDIRPQVSDTGLFTLSALGLFAFSPDGSRLAFIERMMSILNF